ncbi:MAG: GNAT family N-acetyltransferase, partial [Actinobacteria bacterium]|nr:GNAT family N-acetyltransferase [Actinomycetota bacterium]
GHALITEAEEHWRQSGYEVAVLWVLESNERTRRFYERHGWVEDGARRMHDLGDVDRPVVRYTKLLE